MKARELKRGMVIGGREIVKARAGVGSSKGWVYLEYADGRAEGDRMRGTALVVVDA